MMRESLESLGYRVLLAEDGEEAMEKFSTHRQAISLTVLDILMPRLSGPEVYAKICKLAPGLPVIFTSGYSEQRGLPLSSNSTNAVLLQKPFDSRPWDEGSASSSTSLNQRRSSKTPKSGKLRSQCAAPPMR